MSRPRLMIDGMYLVYRSHFSHRTLVDEQGRPTGALYGFLDLLRRLRKEFKDYEPSVYWDLELNKRYWRREYFPAYKGNRKKDDDSGVKEALEQLIPIKTALHHLGVDQFAVDGVEADDLIAVACRQLRDLVLIFSKDQDLYQLLTESHRVAVLDVKGTRLRFYTADDFITDYGLAPCVWSRVKAFAGDLSDNFKPVKGLGPKTAIKMVLLGGDPSIDYDSQPKIVTTRVRPEQWEAVCQAYELAKLPKSWRDSHFDEEQSKEVMQMVRALRSSKTEKPSYRAFIGLCSSYGMYSLIEKWRQFL